MGKKLGMLAVALSIVLPAARAPARTVVTISFDDVFVSQREVPALLGEFGLRASFFVNSNRVGRTGRLGWDDLRALAAAGHEIGGHTLDHEDLTEISLTEVRRQVCDDRAAIVAEGFEPISFAYPFGHSDAASAQIVGDCGYQFARKNGGIRSPTGCSSCPTAEPIPPSDPLQLRSSQSIRNTYSLTDLQGYVLRAEQGGGGWINFNFHEVQASCGGDTYCIDRDLLRDFLAWLAPRSAFDTVVLPMGEAFGPGTPDVTAPLVEITAPADGQVVSGRVSLSAAASDDVRVEGVDFLVNGALVGRDLTAPYAITWDSTVLPNGPATIEAQAFDAAGNVGISAPVLLAVANTAPVSVHLPFGSTWSYWDTGVDPGRGWQLPSYDDTAWPTGPGQLGYGDGDEATVLQRSTRSPFSVYFRRHLSISGTPTAATLSVLYDDGIAVFVNGTLVLSRNVDRPLDHGRSARGTTENARATAAIPASVLHAGDNVIAVVVKQVGRTSPDLSFDLQLEVRVQ